MDREGLLALRAAIDILLKCPDHVRAELVRWFAPETLRGNGHDPHPAPPPIAIGSGIVPEPLGRAKQRQRKPISAKTDERKLLATMQDNPGLSVVALANAAGSSRLTAGERLRQLAARGVVTKDLAGRWRLVGEEPGPAIASPS